MPLNEELEVIKRDSEGRVTGRHYMCLTDELRKFDPFLAASYRDALSPLRGEIVDYQF
jgi:hypothetical protein